MGKLDGKVVIVTGAARGLGRERLPSPRLSVRCRFSEATFAETHGNGQDAP
jgi:hypothetical protein